MPKDDRIYEKLLQHDRQFILIDRKFVSIDKRFDSIEKKLEGHNMRFVAIDNRFEEVINKIDNFKGAVMDALDHLVVAADRVDKERLVTT